MDSAMLSHIETFIEVKDPNQFSEVKLEWINKGMFLLHPHGIGCKETKTNLHMHDWDFVFQHLSWGVADIWAHKYIANSYRYKFDLSRLTWGPYNWFNRRLLGYK